MKPTKNKIFCTSCHRPKMFFESQAKADNFILYNKEEIEEENGKAPVRSYYCRLCGGWHVTSTPHGLVTRFEKRDERIAAGLDDINRINKDLEGFCREVQDKCYEAYAAIYQGRFDYAQDCLKQCRKMIIPLKHVSEKTYEKWTKWSNHISELEEKLARFTEIINLPEEERESFLAKEDKTQTEEEICMAYQNCQSLFLIETLFEEVEDDILKNDKEAVKEKLIVCRRIVKNYIHCPFKKRLQKEYRNRIRELCNKAHISLDQEAKPRYLIDDKYMKYKEAILYLIKKIENLQQLYDSGDIGECMWQLLIISKGMKELPDNEDTKVLKQQLEYWDNMVASLCD